MESIGGYFQVESSYKKKDYHADALKLNTARNSLEYIFRSEKYTKVYIPFYSCSAMLEPLEKLNIKYEFYSIDENFLPKFNKKLEKDEIIIIINYFGLVRNKISLLVEKYKNVILDNSQDFFFKEFFEIPAIYSCRKFLGVSDGGYLYYPKKELYLNLKQDISYDRMEYLYKKYELGSESAYDLYLENEKKLINQPIKKMSKITENLLNEADYEKIKERRNINFKYLHEKLKKINNLSHLIGKNPIDGPMYYPFLLKTNKKINGNDLKKFLIENKIYIPTYWPEVAKRVKEGSIETNLVSHLVPLPIDQRNTVKEMEHLIKMIELFGNLKI